MLYTDDWFPKIFNFPEDEPLSEKFEKSNMETTYLIMNLGTLFVIIIWIIL
jgi:hypothetical protein